MEQPIITANQVTRTVASLLRQLCLEIGPALGHYEDDPAAVADLGGRYPRDLTGLRFGKLQVTGKSRLESDRWWVNCDCGSRTTCARKSLISGQTKSCGCGETQFTSPMAPSLMGQTFGRLTVVERVAHAQEDRRGAFYRCRCECGGETVTKATHLRSGHSTSCGCKSQETQFQPGSNEPPLAAPEHAARQAPQSLLIGAGSPARFAHRQRPSAAWRAKSWAEKKEAIWERARQAA